MIQRSDRLREGDVGAGVEALQQALAWSGFEVAASEREVRQLGSSTVSALLRFQVAHDLEETGMVDAPTASALYEQVRAIESLEKFEITGYVYRRDGSPWSHATVEAFDLDLRRVQFLGSALTDAKGRYVLRYARERYRLLEAGGADLIVRVPKDCTEHDRDAVTSSKNACAFVGPIFNAPAIASVDLYEDGEIYAGRSEWERVLRLLAPVLGGIPIVDLTESEIAFVAREVDVSRDEIALVVRSTRNAAASQVPAEAWFAVAWTRPKVSALALARSRNPERTLRAAMPQVIPSRDDAWIDAVVRDLAAYTLAHWKDLPGTVSPGFISRLATNDAELANAFTEKLMTFSGDVPSFWASLANDPHLANHVPALKRVTQIAVLTRFHAPLVEALVTQLQDRSVAEALPEIEDETWASLIAQHGHPEDTTASEFIADIRTVLESAYATRFVATRIARLPIDQPEAVAAFLRTHAESLDLRGAPLDQLLADQPDLAQTDARVLEQVQRLQRLHRAVGRVDDLAKVMRNAGPGSPPLGSAGDIARLGRSEVRRRFGEDVAGADRTYERAIAAYRNAVALWGKLRPEIDRPVGRHVPPPLGDNPPAHVPRLADMAIAFCGCEKCRSVLGPAAYLADLLATVERLDAPSGKPKSYLYYRSQPGKEEHSLRRADLGTIKLDCANATTPLPYIDLVNELLEWHAAGNTVPFTYQTTLTADELLVSPENVLASVYESTLVGAVFPWNLPFSLAHETARAFLRHFGIDRHTMMLALKSPLFAPTALDAEAERLGLIPQQRDLILGVTATQPYDVWGLADAGNVVVDPADTTNHPPHNLPPKTWLQVLQYGLHLRLQSGLDQASLIATLESRYVARLANTPIIEWPVTECSFDRAVVHLTVKQATAIHVFTRLARALAWTPETLDVALDVIPKPIADVTLVMLGGVVGLAKRCGLPVVDILAWVSNLPTAVEAREGTSLYARTFLSPSVNPDHQAELALVALTPTTSPFSAPLAAVIGSALGISANDLAHIHAAETLIEARVVDNQLTLEALSALYRIASLARVTRLSIDRLIWLVGLMDLPPLGLLPLPAPVTATVPILEPADAAHLIERFLDVVDLIRTSGFTVDEIVFLTVGEDIGERPLLPTDTTITTRLAELHADLATLARDVGWPFAGALPASFDRAALRSWMAPTASAADVEAMIALIAQVKTPPDAAAVALVARVFAALEPEAGAQAALVVSAQAELTDTTMQKDATKRFTFVATAVLRGVSLVRQRRAIAKKLAEVFALDETAGADLLTDARLATFELVDPAQLGAAFGLAAFAPWYAGYRLLHKQALIATRWKLDGADLAAVVRLGTQGVWTDFDAIPLGRTLAGATKRFTNWVSLARAIRLRNSVPGSSRSLFAAIELARTSAPRPMVIAALAAWRGTDVARLSDVAGVTNLTLATPENIESLFDAQTIVDAIGVSTADAQAFAGPNIDLAPARGVRDAVRASRPIVEWVQIARPLQDRLRTRQRDALVAYLGAKWHMTPRQMFDFFLIDVEMSDCQLTSRTQQAVCSVQLFIQRVTMHLELATNQKPLVMIDDERDEWRSWVSTYDAWVAARSVFLYPESTLDPALRPNKSEPFVQLEKKIDQADVTSDLARDLLLEYLDAVDTVAILDTRAVYRERELILAPASKFSSLSVRIIDRTHVLARTQGAPYRYYYRQLEHSRWTPWELVDLDIDDDHVVMTVVDGRLFAYWAEFKTANGDAMKPNVDIPHKDHAPSPKPNYEIRLAWSERKHGKWLSKRVTRESIKTPIPEFIPNTNTYSSVPPNATPEPADYSLHPIPGAVARKVAGAEFTGKDGDSWILVRCQRVRQVSRYKPPALWWEHGTTDKSVETDTYLGWFTFAGCNGRVATHDVTSSSYVDGQVGPLPDLPENTIVNDDWLQTGELHLQLAGTAQLVLAQTGTTRVAHAMGFTIDNDQFFRPPMVWSDDRRAYAIFENRGHAKLAQWTDADLTDPSTVVANKPVANLWPTIVAQQSHPYRFETFFHPYICSLIQRLNHAPDPWHGLQALLSPSSQGLSAAANEPFESTYLPVPSAIEPPFPQERIEFGFDAAYAAYNWELFLYIPILVADRLRTNQRFEEAIAWLQLVFDPTSLDAAANTANAWQFLPLRGRSELATQELLALLDYKGTDQDLELARRLMEVQLDDWRRNALDPHAVARHRPGAWMRAIIMRYVDTLIAWGDSLFRRETIEGLNQATLMYLLALDVLGTPPPDFPSREVIAAKTYEDLAGLPLDSFSNALVQLENWVPPTGTQSAPTVPVPAGMSFYFCIPRNAKLDAYWDTLADRLYKVRHCLDLDGNLRQLLPFGLTNVLDKARGIGDALDGQGAIPTYRFHILVAKACELAADVQKLGGGLLAALEKKDAETMALLRSSHERALLNAIHDVKLRQVDEATAALDALGKSRDAAQIRLDYYSSRPFTNAEEASHITLVEQSLPLQDAAGAMESLAGFLHLIPDFNVGISGFCGSPVSTFKFGGSQLGGAMSAIGAALRTRAGHLTSQAALAQTIGSYRRRADDWGLQRDLAKTEISQIERQIAAGEIRLEVSRLELANQELQIRQAGEIATFLTTKFTSEELYGWLVEQLGVLYLRAYEIAYDLAKRAERAFQFERGEVDVTFLQPVYFDKLRKGLLAGERLELDLRRMEATFFEQNRRDYEITKHVSLVQDFPDAVIALLTLGWCVIELPETLFDRDHPGHYFRRIKSLALSLPCVGGAFASVNAKVMITSSKVRIDPDPAAPYAENTTTPDPRFGYRWSIVDSFAVSTGQNDAGLFEVNLRDDRYLPCEGAGAIARIRIELPLQQVDLDPRRISDAILHLRYTARDGGEGLKTSATIELTDGAMFASARHDLPDAWKIFSTPGATTRRLAIDLRADRFPYWSVKGSGPTITPTITIVFASSIGTSASISASLTPPNTTAASALTLISTIDNEFTASGTGDPGVPGTWVLEIASSALPAQVDDVAIVAVFAK